MKKLLCLILALALFAAGCGIPLIDNSASSDNKDNQKTELPTVTPKNEQKADAKTATPTPTPSATATPTPSQTPTETPTPAAANVDYAALYTSYLKEITDNRTDIQGYSWQCRSLSDYGQSGNENNTPIALIDITGDRVPELLYVKGVNSGGQYYASELVINTWEDGAMKNLYRGSWDARVAGGFYYVLFTRKGTSDLYAMTSNGDEIWYDNIYLFEKASYGLNMKQILAKESKPDETTPGQDVFTYTVNGKPATETEYNSILKDIYDNTGINVMYSGLGYMLPEMNLSDISSSMSYNDAVAQMTANGAVEITPSETPTPEAEAYLSGVPSKFYLSGGSSNWGAEMTINASGSFSGHYFDAEPSQTGAGYPAGTIYVADFTGSFTDYEVLDQTSFWGRVSNLSISGAAGDTWVEGNTRYIRTDSIGISNGDDCVFYRSGTKTSVLDGASSNAIMSALGWSALPDTLSFWILYNTYKGNVYIADSAAYVPQPVLTVVPTPTPTPTPTNEPTPTPATTDEPTPTPSGDEPSLIIPDSSSKVLTESDIAGLSSADIQLAINEIYARHGYIFKKEELKTYFSKFSWYKPTVSDSEQVYNLMNDTEKKNVNFLSNHL